MRQLFFAMAVLGLTLSQAHGQDTITIAAFGDSLMSGYGLPPLDTFPAQLEARLMGGGYPVKVINDGVAGDTTAGGVARMQSVLQQKPQIVLVEFGGNDILRGFEPDQTRKNIETMLSGFHDAGIKIMVIGQRAPPSYGRAYVDKYNSLYCDLAKKYDAECYTAYYDGLYDRPDLLQQDGIHTTALGVSFVLDRMYPAISRLLNR